MWAYALQLGNSLSFGLTPDVEGFQSALLNFTDSFLGAEKKGLISRALYLLQNWLLIIWSYCKTLLFLGFVDPLIPVPWRILIPRPPSDYHPVTTHSHQSLEQGSLCPTLVICGGKEKEKSSYPAQQFTGRDLYLKGRTPPDLKCTFKVLADYRQTLWTNP